MILFEQGFAPTLQTLTGTLTAERVETWTFDDRQTRRRAEAEFFAEKGIRAICRSAYKPLVCAFREEIRTSGLIRARITCPRHPDAGARRFLLETYPLAALYPDVAFEFSEGEPTGDMPRYHLRLGYADGTETEQSVLAPNRSHSDHAGNRVLSPCGWLIADGEGSALETDYEALFHQTVEAIKAAPWQSEPYFAELNIAASFPAQDEDLGHGDEVLSLTEALHEDFYFSLLEVFQIRSGRPMGDRRLQPGQIVPEIRYGPPAVRVELRPHDATSFSTHMQPLETAGRALSQVQIAAELDRIPGERFQAMSVAGRPVVALHHPGSDRAVMISAGQHANETSSPVGVLRAGHRLMMRQGAHFTLSPLENPDGYALHQRLIGDNPRHMHHAARYTALGDDLEYREGDQLFEKAIRLQAEARVDALLHLNFHGYPAHEWTRPLSGYVPRGFEVWTLPKGFFLVMRHAQGWDDPARRLMEGVTRRLQDVPGLRAFNDAQIALFELHAGETGFEIMNGFPVLISHDPRHRVPMTLITEYPDETVYDDAFRAAHEAQMAAALAAYDALQELPEASFPNGAMV